MDQSLRIAYAGTPDFAVPALTSILNSQHQLLAVITQPDRKSGRGRKIQKSSVKQAITSVNVQLFQPDSINEEDILNELRSLNLDLIVVAAFGQIFSSELLKLPKLGCINIHASLLPRWRGASPIQHAILCGDKQSGITIMQMAPKMDAGDIWLQKACDIDIEETAETLHRKLADLGREFILSAISKVVEPGVKPIIQNENEVTYCSKLTKADGLIDWNLSAVEVMRRVRAFHPWPGAYTFLNGRRVRITQGEVGKENIASMEPGKICNITKHNFTVVAGGGSTVVINELIPEGGKKVSAADFCHSNSLAKQQFNAQSIP